MLIPLLSAGNFVIGMGAFVVIGMLNPMAESLGLSTADAGFLITIYALAYAVASPILVSLTGDISRRVLLSAGLALFALAALASAVAQSAEWLFAARVLAAAGAGIFTPVSAAVAASTSTPDARGRALASVFFGLTLAQVFGVPVGSYVAYTFGWRTSFWLVVVLALPCIIGIWWKVPATLPFQANRLSTLGAALLDWRTMISVAFTATFLGGIYALYTFLSPLFSQTMGYGRDGISLALLVFGIGAVIGNIFGGWMADRFGAYRTLLLLCLVQIAVMPVFSLLPLPDVLVMLLMLVWAVFGWSFMAGQQSRLIAQSPDRQNVVLALNAAAIYVGAAAGSAYGGAVLDIAGLEALGIAAGAVGVIALVNLVVSHRLAGKPG